MNNAAPCWMEARCLSRCTYVIACNARSISLTYTINHIVRQYTSKLGRKATRHHIDAVARTNEPYSCTTCYTFMIATGPLAVIRMGFNFVSRSVPSPFIVLCDVTHAKIHELHSSLCTRAIWKNINAQRQQLSFVYTYLKCDLTAQHNMQTVIIYLKLLYPRNAQCS